MRRWNGDRNRRNATAGTPRLSSPDRQQSSPTGPPASPRMPRSSPSSTASPPTSASPTSCSPPRDSPEPPSPRTPNCARGCSPTGPRSRPSRSSAPPRPTRPPAARPCCRCSPRSMGRSRCSRSGRPAARACIPDRYAYEYVTPDGDVTRLDPDDGPSSVRLRCEIDPASAIPPTDPRGRVARGDRPESSVVREPRRCGVVAGAGVARA